jgi:hypothetical protein
VFSLAGAHSEPFRQLLGQLVWLESVLSYGDQNFGADALGTAVDIDAIYPFADTPQSGIEASSSRFFSRWLFAAVIAIAASASAAPVSGQFVLNGKAFSPTNIAAFYIANEAHPEKFETLVLLSTQPVANDAIARSSSPSTKAMNDPAMKNGSITFYLEPQGKVTMLAAIDGTHFMDTNGMIMGRKAASTRPAPRTRASTSRALSKAGNPLRSTAPRGRSTRRSMCRSCRLTRRANKLAFENHWRTIRRANTGLRRSRCIHFHGQLRD